MALWAVRLMAKLSLPSVFGRAVHGKVPESGPLSSSKKILVI